MNVTELARKLRVNTKELLDLLPEYGFDIGKKAIKTDDRVAQQVMRKWRFIKRDLEEKRRKEFEERKAKERELRREMGKIVKLPSYITVKNFSDRMELPVTQVIMELMKNGILANQNQDIDYDTAAILAEELGFTVEREGSEEDALLDDTHTAELEKTLAGAKNLEKRAPVIVIMGHVDHGKTLLLDTVRKANVVAGEAGGITQHIGAYQTIWKDPKTEDERPITFIDTPGHEAFTMMRSRGAKVADIAILIVAADDGVKPQTKEAIDIIKAAKLPFVVAINKIDKEGADPQRVRTELGQHNIIPEEWGGDVQMVEISAKQNTNIDKLLDILLLVADMSEEHIQADPALPAAGTIVESHVDKGMGAVATVLVQSGTLRKGDPLVVNGEIYGKVRAMKDYKGEHLETAGPSVPAQILGFKVAPNVGDILDVSKASTSEEIDVKQKKVQQTGAERTTVLDAMSSDEHEEGKKTLNLVIKADVLGSLEAIIASLSKIKHDEVGVKIIGKGLGNLNESDVQKAETDGATLVGFNVHANPSAEEMIREKDIHFLQYSVIYDLIDWVKDELNKLLADEKIVTERGVVKILAIFKKAKGSMIVGGKVESGKMLKNALVRIKREGVAMGTGTVKECKIGQSSVKEAVEGNECGMEIETSERIEEGDVLEVYTEERKAREIVFE